MRELTSPIEDVDTDSDKISKFRIVAKREGDKDPFTADVPVKKDTFSLVLPGGYINWPEGKPFPDPIRISIDEKRNLWLNFGVSNKHGFYASLKVSENGDE